MNVHDGSGNAPTVDRSYLGVISSRDGIHATERFVVVVGCQLAESVELGNVPRSLSGSFLDEDGRIGSDVQFPEVLDCVILESSTQCDTLSFSILRNQASSCFPIGHLQGVDGLKRSLDAGVAKVGCGVKNVIAGS